MGKYIPGFNTNSHNTHEFSHHRGTFKSPWSYTPDCMRMGEQGVEDSAIPDWAIMPAVPFHPSGLWRAYLGCRKRRTFLPIVEHLCLAPATWLVRIKCQGLWKGDQCLSPQLPELSGKRTKAAVVRRALGDFLTLWFQPRKEMMWHVSLPQLSQLTHHGSPYCKGPEGTFKN